MKQWISTVAVLGMAILLWSLPGEAGKPFDETLLYGTYSYTMIHMRTGENPGDPPKHCSGYGTIEFREDGTAWIDSTELCSDDSDGTANQMSSERIYVVDDEPFFRIEEVVGAELYWTHCQLVQKGNMFLCDSTLREPEMLALQAVGVRQ